ncbi:hypothetical protein J4461_03385 [Candidatus Pacearchaeota archaeon]|nr:hypothetical protein [Candidatus Pacearchaeota archaeon]
MNRNQVIIGISTFLIFVSLSSLALYSQSEDNIVTGRVLTSGVTLFIEHEPVSVTIHYPVNGTTFNFNPGSQYILDLNVSASVNTSVWWYKLEDLRHLTVVNQSVVFTPNTTFVAARWTNKITVYANDTNNNTGSAYSIFEVNVPNTAPIIGAVDSQIYICEGTQLSYGFNVTDPDEDVVLVRLVNPGTFDIIPGDFHGFTFIQTFIRSGTLTKQHLGLHEEEIYAIDGVNQQNTSDNKHVNITVIEINNAPSISNISGVYTVWTEGENSNLIIQAVINDLESGSDLSSSNFTHNMSFLSGTQFFTMSQSGKAEINANSSHVGVYNLSFCATDNGLSNISPNISLCSQDGTNITACTNFSVTITEENRAPTITDYDPSTLVFNTSGSDTLSFNVTSFDPDGTVPDVYWYRDGSTRIHYSTGSLTSNISYSFGCGVEGNHTIKAEITDGLLNDSVTWNISVANVACAAGGGAVSAAGGGGGGGGGAGLCQTAWACQNWNVCQNTQGSLQQGLLGGDDYRTIKDRCDRTSLGDSSCGFQLRNCQDFNQCNSTFKQPDEITECHYTVNPSCSDSIKNCHDGLCEMLIDCGGPCGPCPTCSDRIQNQGEQGIDCGLPCPNQCLAKVPFIKRDNVRIFLLILNLILLILIIILIARVIIKYLRKRLDKSAEITDDRF